MSDKKEKKEWQVDRLCTDIQDYELVVEKQKTDWKCEQRSENWKWVVSYHGSIVSRGVAASPELAQDLAVANVPAQ